MTSLITFFLFPFALLSQSSDFPEIVTLFQEGRLPETRCLTNLQGKDKDFSLQWKRYRGDSRYFMAMEMAGKKFNISTRLELIRSKPFPLELYIFSPSLKLYGPLSAGGSGGLYVHYFSRDKNGNFHYLGRYPFLIYDETSGNFIGGENFAPGEHLTHYYKLIDNTLILEKTENSLDNG